MTSLIPPNPPFSPKSHVQVLLVLSQVEYSGQTVFPHNSTLIGTHLPSRSFSKPSAHEHWPASHVVFAPHFIVTHWSTQLETPSSSDLIPPNPPFSPKSHVQVLLVLSQVEYSGQTVFPHNSTLIGTHLPSRSFSKPSAHEHWPASHVVFAPHFIVTHWSTQLETPSS